MNQQILVIGFASILSAVTIGLTMKAYFSGKRMLDEESEKEYRSLFCRVKQINLAGVISMCVAFIAAAVVSETSVIATLAMLLLVILMVLIPKLLIQAIWRCPHCGSGLALGGNKGINVKLLARCPSCKKVLCNAMYERKS